MRHSWWASYFARKKWFISRARDTQARSLGFALFCFHNLHTRVLKRGIFFDREKGKSDFQGTLVVCKLQPLSKTWEEAHKNVRHFSENVGEKEKNVGHFLKNVGHFQEKLRVFLSPPSTPPKNTVIFPNCFGCCPTCFFTLFPLLRGLFAHIS